MADEDLFGNEIPPDHGGQRFRLPDESTIDEINLGKADEETQIEAMRSWFFENYQDPVEETPYDSSEGGYIYIYGGPYDAKQVLEDRFAGMVPDDVIDKLADDLGNQSWEWERRPGPGDYDDYILNTIAPPSEHITSFRSNIENIRKLVKTKVEPNQQQFFLRILFASVITAMETYFSDRFVSSITGNTKALRKFVETFPTFKKEVIKLSEIYAKSDNLEHRARLTLLSEVVWHRLINISKMFRDTFGVEFPKDSDLADLLRSIDIRHDLIHRSGKTKDGKEHTITPEGIEKLVDEVDKLIVLIDGQASKFRKDEVEEKNAEGENDMPF